MCKKMQIAVFLVFLFTFINVVHVSAEDQMSIDAIFGQIKVYVNGQRVHKETLLYNGTTYVPLRATAEILKKQVEYDDNIKTAYINNILTEYPQNTEVYEDKISTQIITVYFGRIKLRVDGINVDKETLLYNGITYVPLRATAELMSMEVSYEASTQSAYIYDKTVTAVSKSTTITYAEYPSVLDFGVYINISADKVTKTTQNSIVTYRYNRTGTMAEQLKGYTDELIKLGFVKDDKSTKVGFTVYVKGDVSVSIDVNTKGYILILLQNVNISYISPMYADFPQIPDIGSFSSPSIMFEKKTTEADGGSAYWYKGISESTIQTYITELVKLGYFNDTISTKTNYYIYFKGEIIIIIDAATEKGYVKIIITRTTVSGNTVSYPAEYPSVPVFGGVTPQRVTVTDDGAGHIYWYTNINEIIIQNYIQILTNSGYASDNPNTSTGRYAYLKGSTSVIVDSTTYRIDRYVVITIKTIKSGVSEENPAVQEGYYKEYPTVPDFAYVVRDYWKVPENYITVDGGDHRYKLYTEVWGQKKENDYIGDTDLHAVYVSALTNDGFTLETGNGDTLTATLTKGSIKVTVMKYRDGDLKAYDLPITEYIRITIMQIN